MTQSLCTTPPMTPGLKLVNFPKKNGNTHQLRLKTFLNLIVFEFGRFFCLNLFLHIRLSIGHVSIIPEIKPCTQQFFFHKLANKSLRFPNKVRPRAQSQTELSGVSKCTSLQTSEKCSLV